MAHIMALALLGQAADAKLLLDPSAVEQYGHLLIEALVAIVTIWATIRKALQKPEEAAKGPAASAPVVVAKPTAPAAGNPVVAGGVRDGGAE